MPEQVSLCRGPPRHNGHATMMRIGCRASKHACVQGRLLAKPYLQQDLAQAHAHLPPAAARAAPPRISARPSSSPRAWREPTGASATSPSAPAAAVRPLRCLHCRRRHHLPPTCATACVHCAHTSPPACALHLAAVTRSPMTLLFPLSKTLTACACTCAPRARPRASAQSRSREPRAPVPRFLHALIKSHSSPR